MSPPRLTEGADARARLLAAAAHVTPLDAAAHARLRRRLAARVAAPLRLAPSGLRLAAAFTASLVLGVGATWLLRHRLQDEAAPRFTFAEGAVYQPLPGGGVELRAGSLVLSTGRPVTAFTPELEVSVSQGRVAMAVALGRSEVEVYEGAAEVRREGASVALAAGQQVGSDDARFSAPRLHVTAPAAGGGGCEDPPGVACLERAAQGDDVRAQAALLRLELLALEARAFPRAEALARGALARFPGGVLVPETHLVLLEALSQQRRDADARAEAAWYLEHQRGSPMAPQVSLLLGDLELRSGAWAEAREAYAATLALAPSAELAAEAHYGVGVAELRAGHQPEAQAAFRRALAAAPGGPRAAELTRRLAP